MSDPKTSTRRKRSPKPEPLTEVQAVSEPEPGSSGSSRAARPSRGRKAAPKVPAPIDAPELVAPAAPIAPESGPEPEAAELAGQPAVDADQGEQRGTTAIRARVDCRVLSQAVEKVASARAGRKGVPALQSILVASSAATRTLTLTGYDLSVAIQVEIQDVQVEASGEFLIVPTTLGPVLSQMPETSYLDLDSQSQPGLVQIRCAGITFQEQVSPINNYPELPNLGQQSQPYRLKAAELAVGLQTVGFMADPSEDKITSFILLQFWRGGREGNEDGFAVCAAHSGGLALYTVTDPVHDLTQPDHQVLLPLKAAQAIRKLCYGSPTVECWLDDQGKLMQVTSELQTEEASVRFSVLVRLGEAAAQYPKLRVHLPNPDLGQVTATLDYRQFLEALVRQEATQARTVELTVSLEQVALTTQGGQQGRQVSEQIGADNSGVGVFQAPIKMLTQACKGLECEQVQIVLDSQLPAELLVKDDQEHRLTLVFIDRPLVILMMRMLSPAATPPTADGAGKHRGIRQTAKG